MISRARASESTTTIWSPGSGAPSRPRTSTGVAGRASSTCWPRSFERAFTRPHWPPATMISPRFSVPRLTSTVATGPLPLSSLDSMTTPSASRSGLALSSRISASAEMVCVSSSRPVFLRAETKTAGVWPPMASTCTSYCRSWVSTLSGLASCLSILLTATMIGALAAFACWIASIVCGITPSSAATTRTTMSVALAPRARMDEKAAWPGVSRKVIFSPVLSWT